MITAPIPRVREVELEMPVQQHRHQLGSGHRGRGMIQAGRSARVNGIHLQLLR
jgi:hypothetical protein